MSATAILNLLVGVAIGGWLIFGGVAGKLSEAIVGKDGSSDGKVRTVVEKPVASGGGLILV